MIRMPGSGAAPKPATWLVALGLSAAVAGLVWASGALRCEFGADSDEAAHFVSALMIRDYVAGGFPASPLDYAQNYYLHYPKVGIGHWPPVFHVTAAAWMLVLSPSRLSILALMALIAAALAFCMYRRLREEAGEAIAGGMALVFVCLPIVQRHTHLVMTELWVALLCFGAALIYGRYLERPGWRGALAFSALAVLAIMSNGRALALGLLPGLAVLLGGRLGLVRRWDFWLPALPVLLLCGPWYVLVNRKLSGIGTPGIEFARVAAPSYAGFLVGILGWTLCGLAALGLVVKVVQPRWRDRPGGKWAALTALVLSVWVFHWTIPVGLESRYLVTTLPSLLLLAGAGVRRLAEGIEAFGLRRGAAGPAVLLAAMALFGVERFTVVSKPSDGYPELVRELLAPARFTRSVLLVSADAEREGAFIAEVALREPRPSHIVLRSSKALAYTSWTSAEYRVRFDNVADVEDYLESIPVGLVAVDTDATRRSAPHRRQLVETLRRHPDRWQLVPLEAYRLSRLRVYRQVGHENLPPARLEVGLPSTLGRAFGRM